MSHTTLYGIANCQTMRRAMAWLDARKIPYLFHDYRRAGITPAKLEAWVDEVGFERLLNRSGQTFRRLSEDAKINLERTRAIALMLAHPTVIRRPVLEAGNQLLVGFDEKAWATVFDSGGTS